ncbi:hypothetical protein [Cyclobacterium qasimii]|uniref:Uncharacterized protein n=2 Tax=Cyclobacterium qasimii TaxID=1350429 RepID=S7VCC1_9BACT|nr:hypothetical protein [Cyclobacterium qasimii]EPR67626.1 hypothetical protein ADICYQ_3414 [Cyclobacterium qasimii M12-11B]GEO20888.1 hypothetical protein CQA01_14220 [Cyclobacterium qasimii]
MKKFVGIGILIGLIVSTIIYFNLSYFYYDLIKYVFNIRNKDEIESVSESELVINYFLQDLENTELKSDQEIDSLASLHFSNQFEDFRILNYPNDSNSLDMIIVPFDKNFSILYIEDGKIYSYINIKFNPK